MREDRLYLADIKGTVIEDSDSIHKIKNVLRKKRGDSINIFDGEGCEYRTVIEKINAKRIEFSKVEIFRKATEPGAKVALGFSLLKSGKVDFIVQKGTELGIDEFVPFISKNTVVKKAGKLKLQRWMKIIIGAIAQSKRLFLPSLGDVVSLSHLLKTSDFYDLVLVAHPEATNTVATVLKNLTKSTKNVLLIIGPEGGFSVDEIEQMRTFTNLTMIRISNFTLRAETACLLLSGLVTYFLDKHES